MALPDMVGMVVTDMEATLDFYRLLGLDIPTRVEGEQFVEVITPNSYQLSWNHIDMVKGIDPEWVEPSEQRISLAFKCASPAEVDKLYHQVVEKVYTGYKEPWDAFWGQRYAVVKDPDDNTVDLFETI